MIKIKDLKKSFDGQHVLDGIDMTIDHGKIYGLVGSNGCGKTTILKHIMSIYKADSGHIAVEDKDIKSTNYLDKIYYVQDDLYFPYNYSLDNLYTYEAMLYPTMSQKKYEQLKSFFHVDGDKKLKSMSKGQKKQAAFIMAIASMTPILLLDEIVDGLDAVVRKKFWKVIMTEVMDRELTVLISSHALIELDNICDKVGILHEGKIVKEENIDQLKEETKRVQFAVEDEFEMMHSDAFVILKDTLIGRVHFAVIKGDVSAFQKTLEAQYNVLLFEILTMNLEEIFISELGGLGYGNEEYSTE